MWRFESSPAHKNNQKLPSRGVFGWRLGVNVVKYPHMEKLPSAKIENQVEQNFLTRELELQDRFKDKPKALRLARIFSAVTSVSFNQKENTFGNLN